MDFEEWYVENKQWDNYEDPVKAAWDYQQAKIDELEDFSATVAKAAEEQWSYQQARIDELERKLEKFELAFGYGSE